MKSPRGTYLIMSSVITFCSVTFGTWYVNTNKYIFDKKKLKGGKKGRFESQVSLSELVGASDGPEYHRDIALNIK